MPDLDPSIRIERERAFHNRRFTDDTRKAQEKYYAAVAHGKAAYWDLISQLSQGRDVLEYGCATGDYSIDLARESRSVTGIDVSDVAIAAANATARARAIESARFVVMDAEAMEFPDASFDLVFGSGILHHLDLKRSLPEIARVLRPGATAVFWEPLGHNWLINAYRTFTPEARSADEHPLLKPDFDLVAEHFDEVTLRFYGLTSLAAVPVRDTPLFDTVLRITSALDRALVKMPGVKWQAWYCLMMMRTRR